MHGAAIYPMIDREAMLAKVIETQNDIAALELDATGIMQLIADRAYAWTGADGAAVSEVTGQKIVYRAVAGPMAGTVGVELDAGSSLAGLSATEHQYIYSPDIEADPRADLVTARRFGIRSIVLVPLPHQCAVSGALHILSGRPHAFDSIDITSLRLLAGMLSAALTHASEFEIKKTLLAERSDALARLRDSEERFRSAFASAAIGMALLSLEGRWLQVNESLCRILGYSQTELLAADFQSITFPEDLEKDLELVEQLTRGEIRDYQLVKRYLHRHGHVVWVLLSVSLVRSENREPLYFVSQIQDITQRKAAEEALRISEDEYRTTFEMAGVGKIQVDLQTRRIVRANSKMSEITGYSNEELRAMTFSDPMHPDDAAARQDIPGKMRQGELRTYTSEFRYIHKSGRLVWVSATSAVINDGAGRPSRVVSTILDITERKSAERLEQDRRGVLEMVAKGMPLADVLGKLAVAIEGQLSDAVAAVLVVQDEGVCLHASSLPEPWRQELERRQLKLAAELSTIVWKAPDGCGVSFINIDDAWKELRPLAASHGYNTCWTNTISSKDQAPLGLMLVFHREQRRPAASETQLLSMAAQLSAICIDHHNTTRQLSHLVRHDALTGLPNRILFEDRVQQSIVMAARSGKKVGLMVLDIDKFKLVNDTLGHQAGDHLLQQFAQRLRTQLRASDTMARLGGDEFVIVLPEVGDASQAAAVATKLVASLALPFRIAQQELTITTSIGLALYPTDASDAVALQQKADAALYRVKERGRNGFSF